METLENIFSRRSIRKYTDEKISEDKIQTLLKAAMFAPSARNTQPWHFVIIDDLKTLETIMKFHPYASMLKESSHAILVCGDFNIENAEGYLAINCAAATENILLAAHDLGLGACWIGIYPRMRRVEKLTELLKMPKEIIPISLVALGYPNEVVEKEERFHPERIHRNIW